MPPPELLDYLRTERFNALPYSGGWKEQPYKFIERGIIYFNVYSAVKSYREAMKDAKGFKNWIKYNRDTMKVVNGVKEMRNDINS